MLEFILNICPFVFAGGLIAAAALIGKKTRYRRAAELRELRRQEYAAEIERVGAVVRQLMDASAPLACEIAGAAEENKPEPRVEVVAAPGSCVVRRLVSRQREANERSV